METTIEHFELIVNIKLSNNKYPSAETLYCLPTLLEEQDYCNPSQWFCEDYKTNKKDQFSKN